MQHHPMLICSVTLALLASLPAAALDEILSGHWLSRDRTTLVQMAACPDAPDTMCATVLADTPSDGEPSLIGHTIGRNFVTRSDGTWTGDIVTQKGTRLGATLSMPHANQLDIEICVLIALCDRSTYFRTP